MTTKELFEEYTQHENYIAWYQCRDRKSDAETNLYEQSSKRLPEIIQEVEALVRKETVDEILKLEDSSDLNGFCSVASANIKEYAQSKGIII